MRPFEIARLDEQAKIMINDFSNGEFQSILEDAYCDLR